MLHVPRLQDAVGERLCHVLGEGSCCLRCTVVPRRPVRPKAEAVYSPPDPNVGNLAERRAIGEQLRATRAALASLQRLGAEAIPKAQAALQKQLSALADQKARAMRFAERLQAAKDALANATRQREALEEKRCVRGSAH